MPNHSSMKGGTFRVSYDVCWKSLQLLDHLSPIRLPNFLQSHISISFPSCSKGMFYEKYSAFQEEQETKTFKLFMLWRCINTEKAQIILMPFRIWRHVTSPTSCLHRCISTDRFTLNSGTQTFTHKKQKQKRFSQSRMCSYKTFLAMTVYLII